MPYIGNIVQDFSVNNAMLNTDSVTSIKIDDGTIVNADINDSAAIDVSKLSGVLPLTGGTLTGNLTISRTNPRIIFTDTDNNPDYLIDVQAGHFLIYDSTNSANRLLINSDGHIDLLGNVDITNGLDVTGAITGTGDLTIDTTTLHVDSSNNRVGIGTASPTSKLHIEDSSAVQARLKSTGGDSHIYAEAPNGSSAKLELFEAGTGGFSLRVGDANALMFFDDSAERMRISSAGRVGIGLTNPAAELDVAASVEDGSGTLAEHGIRLSHVGATDEEVLPITGGFVTQTGRVRAGIGFISKIASATEGYAGAIGFYTRSSADGNGLLRTDERMRIDQSGNVGIGTTSPSEKLHVNGNVGINANLIHNGDTDTMLSFSADNQVDIQCASARIGRFTTNGIATGPNKRIDILDASEHRSGVIDNCDSGANSLRLSADPDNSGSSSYMLFAVDGGSEKMRIDSSGNVGIGTTSTGSYPVGVTPRKVQMEIKGAIDTGSATHQGQLALNCTNNMSALHLIRSDNDQTSGRAIGSVMFTYSDGTDFHAAASILAQKGAAGGNNDTPGTLIFNTTADGATAVTERMRIDSSGIVGINNDGTTFGQLCVGMPSQSGGSAIQVMNSASGSGDNSLTNIVLRSVNSIANNWSHAQYRASSHQFQYQSTTKVNINSNGLCFNSDTAAANALDDYEEGTWTPAISGVSYNDAQGTYIKIGTTCFVTLSINQSDTSKSGDTRITGLPFTAKSGSGEYYPANSVPFFEVSGISLSSGYNNIYGRIDYQQSNLQLLVTDGVSHGILTVGSGTTLNSNHSLRTSFTYQTA